MSIMGRKASCWVTLVAASGAKMARFGVPSNPWGAIAKRIAPIHRDFSPGHAKPA